MAFGGGLNDQEDVMSEINVTPLVDVMLVLLVIFILTVPVLTHSVKVDLPQTQKLNTAVDPKSISISVASDGSVYWNSKRIDNAQLETMLAEVAAQEQQTEIRRYGDRRVAYEEVVKIMAAAQRAGIDKLGFVTQPQP